jgi:hypothetical protein
MSPTLTQEQQALVGLLQQSPAYGHLSAGE